MSGSDDGQPYIQRVLQDTQAYVRRQLQENDRLRARTAALEVETARLEEELKRARESVEQQTARERQLVQKLVDAEDESDRVSRQYVDVEQQNLNLANLYVASYRLHGTLDRAAVVDGIKEIVINLIGSEEFGIWEMTGARDSLRLCTSVGLDAGSFDHLSLDDGVIGATVRSGRTWIRPFHAEDAVGAEEVTACIPLRVDERVTGIIAIFRLLPQKPGLGPIDLELFDLLATHAASALYCADLHARLGGGSEHE